MRHVLNTIKDPVFGLYCLKPVRKIKKAIIDRPLVITDIIPKIYFHIQMISRYYNSGIAIPVLFPYPVNKLVRLSEGNSSGEYEKFLPGLKGMGEILEENGYQNYFMCGSDVEFGGRKDFYEQHGNQGAQITHTMQSFSLLS